MRDDAEGPRMRFMMNALSREPYRPFFALGAALSLIGAGLWPLAMIPGFPYPGALHPVYMIEGFELAFVSGFLLTIVPRLTRTDPEVRALPWLLGLSLAVAILGAAGLLAVSHACALALLLLLAFTVARRFLKRRNDPPEEVVFVPVGLALGMTGVALQLASALGFVEPAPRLGMRLVSLGMVLSFVLGFGALLVPVFLEIRDPLVIPGVAAPHQRARRRALYAAAALALVLTFVADAAGLARPAAFARAALVSIMLAWVWKIGRAPGRHTFAAWALWSAGWFIGAGLWLAALWPAGEIAALHVTLLGGFGTLTLGIASRVVVTHGGHAPTAEARLVTPARAAWLALALGARLFAQLDPAHGPHWLALSGTCWIAAWLGWLLSAFSSPRSSP
jgi:uncharacterized protein involved in response to NO